MYVVSCACKNIKRASSKHNRPIELHCVILVDRDDNSRWNFSYVKSHVCFSHTEKIAVTGQILIRFSRIDATSTF